MADNGAHILVVEDNPVNYELVNKILKHMGHRSTTITDGETAYKWCQENAAPDLILMDISLPGMDGQQLTGKIREMPGYSDTPIVALTAHAMKGDDERFLSAGCDRYLAKPFGLAQLVALVNEILGE